MLATTCANKTGKTLSFVMSHLLVSLTCLRCLVCHYEWNRVLFLVIDHLQQATSFQTFRPGSNKPFNFGPDFWMKPWAKCYSICYPVNFFLSQYQGLKKHSKFQSLTFNCYCYFYYYIIHTFNLVNVIKSSMMPTMVMPGCKIAIAIAGSSAHWSHELGDHLEMCSRNQK